MWSIFTPNAQRWRNWALLTGCSLLLRDTRHRAGRVSARPLRPRPHSLRAAPRVPVPPPSARPALPCRRPVPAHPSHPGPVPPPRPPNPHPRPLPTPGPHVTRRTDGRPSGGEPRAGRTSQDSKAAPGRGVWAGWGGAAAGTSRAGPGQGRRRGLGLPTAGRPQRRRVPRRSRRARWGPAPARLSPARRDPGSARAHPARPRPLLPARPERENGVRLASGSDARPHLHAGAASQWGKSVYGTPGHCPTGP